MDFQEQLRKQLRFLATSCSAYDAGDTDEAIRIATALRILFHDTAASTSLLQHLRARHGQVLSTCDDIPAGATFWPNLTVMILSPAHGVAEFNPKLDQAHRKRLVSVARWWERDIVYLTAAERLELTRKKLVLAATNKDGGAHVDSAFPSDYDLVRSGAGWSMTVTPADGTGPIAVPFKDAHLAALRQMGYEVLNSPDIERLAAPVQR